jgi:hypothetical protein
MPSHQCLVKGLNMIEGNKDVNEGSFITWWGEECYWRYYRE